MDLPYTMVSDSKPTLITATSSRPQLSTSTGTTLTTSQQLNQSAPKQYPASLPSSSPSNTNYTASALPDNPLSIQVYLQHQHREVKPSRGDENCLFRSYSFQLFGSEEEHISVCTAAARFENLNQSAFSPYLTSINKATITEHIQHVQRPSVFGTHIEILAIATLFNVPTFYCCSNGRDLQYRWHCVTPLTQQGLRHPDLSGSPLENVQPPTHFELLYIHNVHYDSIVSANGELCTEFPILSTTEIYVDLS